jgi:tetratricopeptide (TPR) repeat protein
MASAQTDIQALIDGGHLKRAKTAIEERLRKNPNDGDALQLKSRTLMNTDLDQAAQLAEKATQVDSSNANAFAQLANAKGRKAQKASVFSQMGLARDAKKAGDKALEINPNHPDALNFLIAFHREAPSIVGGDKKKADVYMQRLLKADPVRGNLVLAENAADDKQVDKLEGLYKMAYQSNPKDYRALLNLGAFYANDKAKNYALAEQYLREATKLDASRAQAWSPLTSVLALEKKWAEVEATVAQAEKAVPDNWNPMFQAARIMVVTGENFPLAEKYLRKYMTQEPELNAPDFAAAHWRLGQILEKQGKKQEAIAEMETALKLRPDFEQAKQDLKRLKG